MLNEISPPEVTPLRGAQRKEESAPAVEAGLKCGERRKAKTLKYE